MSMLADYFSATPDLRQNLAAAVNVPPGTAPLIIESAQNDNGDFERVITRRFWGYLPAWAGPDFDINPVINARIEGIRDKKFYADAIRHHRCIVPATGFYEWAAIGDSGTGKQEKQPHVIARRQITDPARLEKQQIVPLALAAVWAESPHLPDGHTAGFAIMTRPAPNNIDHLHHRAPVILSRHQVDPWLSGGDPGKLLDKLEQNTQMALNHWPVSKEINYPENNDIDLLREVVPTAPAQESLF
jgi:putative SOS response-associated peptidase YedK